MARQQQSNSNLALNLGLAIGAVALLVLLWGLFSSQRPAPPQDLIQVEVLNGSGISGLAGCTTQYLRQQQRGFDVVEMGNYASSNLEQTLVLDRVGNPEAARRVARALGVPESQIRQEIEQDYRRDVSVLLGLDYAALSPHQDEACDATP